MRRGLRDARSDSTHLAASEGGRAESLRHEYEGEIREREERPSALAAELAERERQLAEQRAQSAATQQRYEARIMGIAGGRALAGGRPLSTFIGPR